MNYYNRKLKDSKQSPLRRSIRSSPHKFPKDAAESQIDHILTQLASLMDIAQRLPERVKPELLNRFGLMKEELRETRKWLGKEGVKMDEHNQGEGELIRVEAVVVQEEERDDGKDNGDKEQSEPPEVPVEKHQQAIIESKKIERQESQPILMPPAVTNAPEPLSNSPVASIKLQMQILSSSKVTLQSLKLFQPRSLHKLQKDQSVWAVVTQDPLTALSIKYFDIASQTNLSCLTTIKSILLQCDISTIDIKSPLPGEKDTIYLKKIFTQFLDELHEQSTLEMLEHYEGVEESVRVALKAVLMRVDGKMDKQGDSVVRVEQVIKVYERLQEILGMQVTRKGNVIAVVVSGKGFRIEVLEDTIQTYLEEDVDGAVEELNRIQEDRENQEHQIMDYSQNFSLPTRNDDQFGHQMPELGHFHSNEADI